MRIGISNLAFDLDCTVSIAQQLRQIGISGIEVAPTRIADWPDLTTKKTLEYRKLVEDCGMTIPSLQAIFYGKTDLALLGDEFAFANLREHAKRVAEVGGLLGASVAVFGAPKQRLRGLMTHEAAFGLAHKRLYELCGVMHSEGVRIGLEPVPSFYGGDFLQTWQEVRELVNQVGHPGLGVHLDTGCVLLGGGHIGESVSMCSDRLLHFHAAEPNLSSFVRPQALHPEAAEALKKVDYGGWVVIEMLMQKESTRQLVIDAACFVNEIYN